MGKIAYEGYGIVEGRPNKRGENMANQHASVWTRNYNDKITKLFTLRDEQYSFDEIAAIMRETYKEPFTDSNCSAKYYRELPNKDDLTEETYEPPFKENIKHKANGEIEHDKLVQLTEEDAKSKQRVMELCGYDPGEWQVVDCEVGFWTYRDKETPEGKISRKCKLKVKPKEDGFDFDKLLETIKEMPQVTIKPKYIQHDESYLNLPLLDLHFGISNYEDYKETQAKVLHLLKRNHKEVLLIIGSDLFHHNDHRNRTASGREIEHADMTKAWDEAVKFYEPIIKEAIKQSKTVYGMFIKGNHSESLEWAFTKYLEARFPQVIFDTRFKERKVQMLGNCMICSTHGDKAKLKKLGELFSTEYPIEWSQAKTREAYAGHLHHEEVKDQGGIVLRQLSTRNKDDSWHEDMGYTTAHKRFQVFEYSRDELETIHYV